MTRYIFVSGGVMSGLGKGITTSSIARLIQDRGYEVSCLKIDPYVNIDAGTMRPTEHGEIFVTQDGGEIDQDLGNYERFLNKNLSKDHNMTTGKVYRRLIKKERKGDFLGKTVQIIPHLTDEIIGKIKELGEENDFLVIEVGGTVGDYENIPFLEAARQMRLETGEEKVLFVHVTYLPIIKAIGEQKTKPTQHSVKMLREVGIEPDFIIGRSEEPLDEVRKKKISLFCDVEKEKIISTPNIDNIYDVPMLMEEQKVGEKILNQTNLEPKVNNFHKWKKAVKKMKNNEEEIKIGMVGKYVSSGDFSLRDSYISINEAIKHGSGKVGVSSEIQWIDSTDPEKAQKKAQEVDAIIIPGGFGTSGIEGKLKTIEKCRKDNIPFLGLCLGLQLAIVEHARNVVGLEDAHSTEIEENTPYPVIDLLPEQQDVEKKGGTMRLGSYPAILEPETKTRKIYGEKEIKERHRHRYEVNPKYHEDLEKEGLIFSGKSPNGKLVEFIERENHPYFLATQAHPEYNSRPEDPHPLFVGLIKSAKNR